MESYLGKLIDRKEEEIFREDCDKYDFVPSIFPAQKKIVVLGDIHGDFELVKQCLLLGGVINKKNKWIGKETIVVSIGDQNDSFRPNQFSTTNRVPMQNDKPDDVKILKFFTSLDKQAQKDGGRVISLLGNHELMVVNGDNSYASNANIMNFLEEEDDGLSSDEKYERALERRIRAFAPGNELAEFLGCTRLSAVKIGTNLFVHGGFVPEYLSKAEIDSPEKLVVFNTFVRRYLLNKIRGPIVKDLISGSSKSPFWNRKFGTALPDLSMDDDLCEKYLTPVLKIFQVGTMIIGHTIQFSKNNEGINSTCDNGVQRVDFGGSSAFNAFDPEATNLNERSRIRKAQVLIVENDNKYRVIRIKN